MNDPSDRSIQHFIDEQHDRFENALTAGQEPDVEAFLAAVPESVREQLMRELTGLEQDYVRSRSGFEPTVAPPDIYRTSPETDHTINNGWTGPAPAAGTTLDHPGIVPIYEVGEHNDHHYFSMGLVEGPSLSETLRDGPLASRTVAEMLAKIADAIGYANAKGIIHRDLKPGNVLLDSDRDPHITDFGLAKRLRADQELTTTGEVLGTPAYMPPEQPRGDLTAIGPRSDVYSLGAILFAMLSESQMVPPTLC